MSSACGTFITSDHQAQTICPLVSGGHCVLINYWCVFSDQGETLYLTMCLLIQKWVNLCVSLSACLIWVEAIKRYACCADALSIMAGSVPNVTFCHCD